MENIIKKESWHSTEIKKVLEDLDSTKEGLSQNDANKRKEEFGSNEIKKKSSSTPLTIFLNQFKSFLVVILIIAAIVSYLVGMESGDTIDTWVIIAILILNALFGFFQEYKAERAIEALQRMAALKTTVIREGKKHEIDAKELVPGDILSLEAGDKIPADARLIELSNLEVDESALTGESLPIKKDLKLLKEETELADQKDMIFSGTIITKGSCLAIVVGTGMKTELGKIANLMQNTKKTLTPLQRKLEKFGEYLGIGILAICALVFLVSFFNYQGAVIDSLMIAISLAVAAIPEGLAAIVTICLALGVQRMIKRNALIRRLPSVETLGSTDVICTDKTGTLTYNQMTVREVFANGKVIHVSGHGYNPEGHFLNHNNEDIDTKNMVRLFTCATLCNNSSLDKKDNKWTIVGDPTEGALTVMAKKANYNKEELERKMPRLSENPFDSERKMMSTVNQVGKNKILFVKGAPDELLKNCNTISHNGKVVKLTENMKLKILEQNTNMARKALRVLGLAYKEAKKDTKEDNLIFLGLVGMIDPPRKEVIESIKKCKKAGIKVVMITGDHKETALAIAKELGIGKHAITGEELDNIKNLEETVELIEVYARVKPEHKLRIVKALKQQGHVVAMTGDGVNDAPALKGSDIGVAMGITGTDVSKEAADMILTDDNFASIVNAVEEGRGIYDNIKKFLKYLVSSNSGEVMTIFIGTTIGFVSLATGNVLPLLLPIHLLWINLVTDSFLALALGVDPLNKDVMKKKPRKQKENFIDKNGVLDIIITAIVMALGTIFVFKTSMTQGDMYAQTMALTTLVVFQLFNVFNCRTERKSIITNIFNNKWLWLAIGGCIIMQLVVLYTPLSIYMKTTPLGISDWLFIMGVSSTVIIAIEIKKLISRVIYRQ